MGIETTKCCTFSSYEEKKFENFGTPETNIRYNKSKKINMINKIKLTRNKGNDSKKTTFTSRKEHLNQEIKINESYESTININDDFLITENETSKIIKIQSIYRRYISKKNFNKNLKPLFLKNQIELFNDLYEKYMKFNTKLAESLIGYKFDKSKIEKRENEKILNTLILINPNELIKNFYSGEVDIENNRNGYGIRLFNDGTKYEGEWEKNDFTGFGRIIKSNGDLFEGNFQKGKIYGYGIKKKLNGYVYQGDFLNGMKDGFGIEENEDFKYKGEFNKDIRKGKGEIFFKKNKESYEGEFEEGKINGIGIYTFKNGDIYEGQFKNGKMNGKGVFKWKSGEEYYGEYVNGIKEGNGIYKYLNGKIYDGQFRKGRPSGNGKVFFDKGNIQYKVIFQNGKLIQSEKII